MLMRVQSLAYACTLRTPMQTLGEVLHASRLVSTQSLVKR